MPKTEATRSKKGKLPESRQKRANKRLMVDLLLWIIICGILSLIFAGIEAGWLAVFVLILGFNLATTDVLRHYVRQHGRNVVSWTTASIVFTPILAGIVYLLTWPKGKKLTGLE